MYVYFIFNQADLLLYLLWINSSLYLSVGGEQQQRFVFSISDCTEKNTRVILTHAPLSNARNAVRHEWK